MILKEVNFFNLDHDISRRKASEILTILKQKARNNQEINKFDALMNNLGKLH
jgi:hypothetical protein